MCHQICQYIKVNRNVVLFTNVDFTINNTFDYERSFKIGLKNSNGTFNQTKYFTYTLYTVQQNKCKYHQEFPLCSYNFCFNSCLYLICYVLNIMSLECTPWWENWKLELHFRTENLYGIEINSRSLIGVDIQYNHIVA